MLFKFVIVLIFSLLTSGCNYSSNAEKYAEIAKLEELEKKVSELEWDLIMAKTRSEKYTSASFDPAEGKEYQRLDTSSGTLLVSFLDAKTHLDGVKVKLNIGNLQYADYRGFELMIEYGKRYPKYIKDQPEQNKKNRLEYEASKRKKEEKFTQVLKSGSWNTIEIFLPDVKPSDFGNLQVKINLNTIALFQR